MNYKFLVTAIFCIFAFIESQVFGATDSEMARETLSFLNQFSVLRMGVVDASGNGHQASAVTVIKRLRFIGYKGHIELYFAAGAKKKLEFLLPPFSASAGDHQFIGDLDVETFALEVRPAQRVPLAILAGTNFEVSSEDLNAENLLVIHPPNWNAAPILSNSKLSVAFREIPTNYPYRLDGHAPRDIKQFVENQTNHSQDLKAKAVGLTELLNLRIKNNIDLLAAYGLGIGGQEKLVTLLRSLLLAKERFEGPPIPIVVGLLSNLNFDEWENIYNKLVRYPQLASRLKILDVRSKNISSELENLQSDQIAILKIGNVSQDLWEYLMQQSSLPPLVAGSNGFNFLLQQGKPFIATQIERAALSAKESTKVPFLLKMMNLSFYLLFENDVAIASFITEARIAGSDLHVAFKNYAEKITNLPDRTCAALLAAQKDWHLLNPAPLKKLPNAGERLKSYFERLYILEKRAL